MSTAWITRISGVIITALVVVGAVACGGGKSDEDKIKDRVNSYFANFNKADARGLINDLPPSKRGSCDEQKIKQSLDESKGTRVELKTLKVNNITGGRATVTSTVALTLPGEQPQETTNDDGKLIKEGDGWYLDLENQDCSNFLS